MIRIMHFVDLPCANPWLNGIASHYDRQHFQHLVTSLGPRCDLHDQLEMRGVPAFALNVERRSQYPWAIARLTKALREQQVDILQTHLFYPSILGLLAARLAGTRCKIVTRHHSDFTTLFHRPLHRRLDRWQALAADHVMAASQAVKDSMVQFEGVPPNKISVARYGYDFTLLRPQLSAEQRRQVRSEFGDESTFLIGTVARLSIEKGHQYLLRSLVHVVEQHPHVRLLLLGTGPLRDKLGALVHGLGLDQHVQFLGWRSDAWKIIEASDLMVHPTLHEAFCGVIIEAMALERPLVVTNVAAAPEQIDDRETGRLVPPRDAQSIANAVLELMADPGGASRMGQEARRRVNERFNFPRMMLQYEQMYCSYLQSRGAA